MTDPLQERIRAVVEPLIERRIDPAAIRAEVRRQLGVGIGLGGGGHRCPVCEAWGGGGHGGFCPYNDEGWPVIAGGPAPGEAGWPSGDLGRPWS